MTIKALTGEYNDVLTDAYLTANVTVGTTEVEAKCGAAILPQRELVIIYNNSNEIIYHGPSGVTVSNGIPIFKRETVWLYAMIPVYLIAETAGNSVIVQELS